MKFPSNDYIDALYSYAMGISANDVGQVYYRVSTDSMTRIRASNAVGGSQSAATYVVIVTWHKLTFKGGSNTSPVSVLLCMYLLCITTFCHTSTSHPGDITADWFSNVFNNLT